MAGGNYTMTPNSSAITNPSFDPTRQDVVWPIEIAAGPLLRPGTTPLVLRARGYA